MKEYREKFHFTQIINSLNHSLSAKKDDFGSDYMELDHMNANESSILYDFIGDDMYID